MQEKVHRYFIVNKPNDMVSQFVSSHAVRVLGDLGYDFPEGTHCIGRLDNHSEGLLILTTDKRVTRWLFQSKTPHRRRYLVKVRYAVSEESLARLREGVSIQIRGGGYYVTAPCEAELAGEVVTRKVGVEEVGMGDLGWIREEGLGWIREGEGRDYVPVTWLWLTLTEGKFHQVRKMVDAVGHRCLRLIRVSIEGLALDGLEAGGVREVGETEFFERLGIGR